MLIGNIPQIMHSLKRELVPYILRHRSREALPPPARLSLSRHPPTLMPVGVLIVEKTKAGCLFLSAHALEAGLGYRPPNNFFAVVQTSPLGDLQSRGKQRNGITGAAKE